MDYALMQRLREIIFPKRLQKTAQAVKDESDLTHLSTCIHHRVFAFITSEKAILREGEALRREFGLSILSPSEFRLAFDYLEPELPAVRIQHKNSEISVNTFKEDERAEVESFLGSFGLQTSEINQAWRPGTSRSRRPRLCVRLNGELVGAAAWDNFTRHSEDVPLYIFLDESQTVTDKIIDHLLESASRNIGRVGPKRAVLHIGKPQALTRQVALQRGFQKLSPVTEKANTDLLWKISASGIVTPKTWDSFCTDFKRLTRLTLPQEMPNYSNVTRHGLRVVHSDTTHFVVNVFTFETLVSPVIFLFPGRNGLVVPIRRVFAEELLGSTDGQLTLLSAPEALLHIEKAYFRDRRSARKFAISTPIVFYVSGKSGGPKNAVGIARVSYSGLHSPTAAGIQFKRQGVLDERSLRKIAGNDRLLHVFTFDNFQPFQKTISFQQLKRHDCVDRANLITAQELAIEKLTWICNEGFGNEGN